MAVRGLHAGPRTDLGRLGEMMETATDPRRITPAAAYEHARLCYDAQRAALEKPETIPAWEGLTLGQQVAALMQARAELERGSQ
jgi:hypothetical protein